MYHKISKAAFELRRELYGILLNRVALGLIPTDDLIPKTWHGRNQHSIFQTPIASTDVYKGSFFPYTIRDWNVLPDSLISSAEVVEDCVAKV